MITGEQLLQARQAALMAQEEVAKAVGVTLRSVGNWERGAGVPRNREALVRAVLGQFLGGDQVSDSLSGASDLALLAELGRRLDRARMQGGSDAGNAEAEKNVTRTDYALAARRGRVQQSPDAIDQAVAGEDNQDDGNIADCGRCLDGLRVFVLWVYWEKATPPPVVRASLELIGVRRVVP